MPKAPDLDTLLDFEGEMETGWSKQFDCDGLPSINKQQDDDDLVTPRYAFKFSSSGVFNGHSALCDDGLQRYDMLKGMMEVQVYTHRSENKAQHKRYRSGARRVALGFRKRFGPDVMPYYEIGEVREAGSQPSVRGEDDIDATALLFEVVFQIRQDAWPDDLT